MFRKILRPQIVWDGRSILILDQLADMWQYHQEDGGIL